MYWRKVEAFDLGTTGQWAPPMTILPLLRQICTDHSGWTYADLLERLGLPHSKMLEALAREAGFTIPDELMPEQQNAVLKVMLEGVFGPKAIARETGLPLKKVKKYCQEVGVPLGSGGHEMLPWPEEEPVGKRRKVSETGQLCYMKRVYGLGRKFSGQTVWVEEDGKSLIVRFGKGVEKRMRR